jgi:alpha-D-ribose 1-methylphosphonate 5-triphosphate synthase subunit PhnH
VQQDQSAAGVPDVSYTDSVRQSQATFRHILDAMARPGTCHRIADAPNAVGALNAASTAVALTLLDESTPVWLDDEADTPALRTFLSFHCGCPFVVSSGEAAFALIAGQIPDLECFNPGTDEFPEISATVVAQVAAVDTGADLFLAGPGIQTVAGLADPGLPASFWRAWDEVAALYPCGVDVVLTAGERLVCLPRSVRRVQDDESKPKTGASECM